MPSVFDMTVVAAKTTHFSVGMTGSHLKTTLSFPSKLTNLLYPSSETSTLGTFGSILVPPNPVIVQWTMMLGQKPYWSIMVVTSVNNFSGSFEIRMAGRLCMKTQSFQDVSRAASPRSVTPMRFLFSIAMPSIINALIDQRCQTRLAYVDQPS